MAASSRSGVSAKLGLLAIVIAAAIAVYSAGWFYAAAELKERSLALLGNHQGRGISAECDDADYRGFPFRIGLFCSRVAVDDSVNGISATFGALRSAAQIYNPGHIVWELDSPVEIRTSHGLSISALWENFQSSLNADLDGLKRSSLVLEKTKATILSPAIDRPLDITTARTELHLRQNGADLDAAATLTDTDIVLRDLPQLLPRLTATADLTLKDRGAIVTGKDPAGLSLHSSEGALRSFTADLGQGRRLTLSGPFSFDRDGYLSGRLRLGIEAIPAWRNGLTEAFPELAPTLTTVFSTLSALAKGGDNASLDLTISRGRVLLGGFITIGEIPPL